VIFNSYVNVYQRVKASIEKPASHQDGCTIEVPVLYSAYDAHLWNALLNGEDQRPGCATVQRWMCVWWWFPEVVVPMV
jgi:hypothetical protein